MKSDKGESIAIMTPTEYDYKMIQLLQNSGAIRTKFSLKAHNDEARRQIKSSPHVTGDHHKHLIPMTYSLPKL